MSASGLANAPISRNLLFLTISASILATLTDTKHLLPIHIPLHFGRQQQFWRLLTWQSAYANSSEVLFAALTLYQLRVVERIWGSRKFATFILTTALYTSVISPLVMTVLSPLLPYNFAFLPAGPTSLVFALLAQYHAAIPYTFRYRLSSSGYNTSSQQAGSDSSQEDVHGILLTSKATSYLFPAQLALSQLPGSLIAALVGWCVGYAWRAEILFGTGKWRVPAWMFGAKVPQAARSRPH